MEYGYIYKLSYKDLDYYGSTIKTPSERYIKHNTDRRCSSKIIFEEAEKNNEKPTFEVLLCFDEYKCKDCRRQVEQTYIDKYPCVNQHNAFGRNKVNREKNKQSQYKHYQANRDRIIEKRKIAYQEGRVKSKWSNLSREEKDIINTRRRETRKLKKEQSLI
jgi:DNA-directed RNA polymerase subunit RPC12/RpoP